MNASMWQPLRSELAEWRAHDIVPRLWLRDDDAVAPTGDLDRLIELTARYRVEIVLAVIPARAGEALARRLDGAPHVFPAVHGWSHANHAPDGEKRQELGLHRELSVVLEDCARGLARLRGLYGEKLLAMMVPPWNRIAPAVAAELPQLGFRALSAFGRKTTPTVSRLTICNAHIDLIDSRGTRKCREAPFLIEWFVSELREARRRGEHTLGVLSHHLAGDPMQLEFLGTLFEETSSLWQPPFIAR